MQPNRSSNPRLTSPGSGAAPHTTHWRLDVSRRPASGCSSRYTIMVGTSAVTVTRNSSISRSATPASNHRRHVTDGRVGLTGRDQPPEVHHVVARTADDDQVPDGRRSGSSFPHLG